MCRRSQCHWPSHLQKPTANKSICTLWDPSLAWVQTYEHLPYFPHGPIQCLSVPPGALNTWLVIWQVGVFFPSQHPSPFFFFFFGSGNASQCEYLIENEWEICKFLQTPTNFLMIFVTLQWMVLLQLQEVWATEYSNHIVPASETWGCFTRQMPTLPGAGKHTITLV